jgi:hypothetical protein
VLEPGVHFGVRDKSFFDFGGFLVFSSELESELRGKEDNIRHNN